MESRLEAKAYKQVVMPLRSVLAVKEFFTECSPMSSKTPMDRYNQPTASPRGSTIRGLVPNMPSSWTEEERSTLLPQTRRLHKPSRFCLRLRESCPHWNRNT